MNATAITNNEATQPHTPRMVTDREAARMLGLSEITIRKWRMEPGHPLRWHKLGRAVRYSVQDIQAFIESSRIEAPQV